MRVDKLLASMSAFLVAAAPQGSFEVVKSSSPEIVNVLVVLTTVTSLTFILLLLACGMRKPLL